MYNVHWTASKFFYAAGGVLLSFTQDVQDAALGVFILILVDTISGFMAAPYRGKKRTSRGLSRFVQKIITYGTAIIVMHVFEKLMFPDWAEGVQLAHIGCWAIGAIEIHSIFENLYDITKLEVFQFLTQLSFKKIGEKIGMDIKKPDSDK